MRQSCEAKEKRARFLIIRLGKRDSIRTHSIKAFLQSPRNCDSEERAGHGEAKKRNKKIQVLIFENDCFFCMFLVLDESKTRMKSQEKTVSV